MPNTRENSVFIPDQSSEYESAEEDPDRESRELINASTSEVSESSYVSARKEKGRNLIAFWFLGLTNNFAYVVMLSAAHDILSEDFNKASDDPSTKPSNNTNPRDCNIMSTGTVLLADIIPALAIKMMAPFIPIFIHLRIGTVVFLCSVSFLLVGVAVHSTTALLGVIFASASSGLGETTFLAYSVYYHEDVVSTWSSGTGGAGLFGSLSYAALTSLGLTPRQTVLSMLVVPVIMSISFWRVLEHPTRARGIQSLLEDQDQSAAGREEDVVLITRGGRLSLDEKMRIIPSLLKYMAPLSLVYVAEYVINQGLSELIYFPASSSWITHDQQYRWYQVVYQTGVLISRSSVNLVYIQRIWITALLQWLNVIIFTTGAVYWWFGTIWLAFVLILWEGLLGGAAYVNTFYRLSKEVNEDEKEFAIQMTSMSDTFGVTLAGFLAIPIHNLICKLPLL